MESDTFGRCKEISLSIYSLEGLKLLLFFAEKKLSFVVFFSSSVSKPSFISLLLLRKKISTAHFSMIHFYRLIAHMLIFYFHPPNLLSSSFSSSCVSVTFRQ